MEAGLPENGLLSVLLSQGLCIFSFTATHSYDHYCILMGSDAPEQPLDGRLSRRIYPEVIYSSSELT